jgi:hypothetical protein
MSEYRDLYYRRRAELLGQNLPNQESTQEPELVESVKTAQRISLNFILGFFLAFSLLANFLLYEIHETAIGIRHSPEYAVWQYRNNPKKYPNNQFFKDALNTICK